MNEIWNLKNMIESLGKAELLNTIEEKMQTHSELSKHKPFYEVKLAYDNNKTQILELANEYITRYNELPVVTISSNKDEIDYPLKEIGD